MKIAIYSDSYYPTIDGVVVSINSLRKNLIRQGHKCLMVVPNTGLRLDYLKSHILLPSMPFLGYEGYRVSAFPSMHYRYIKKFNPDIFNLHGIAFTGFKGMYAAKYSKTPVVTTYHTNIIESLHYLSENEHVKNGIKKYAVFYLDWFLRNSDAVIVPSKATKEELEDKFRKTYYEIIPNSLDISRFSGVKPKVKNKDDFCNGIKLLCTGRIAREKKLEVMLESLTMLPEEYSLDVIGKGPASDYYVRLAKKLGLKNRVNFLGFVDDAAMATHYRNSHIFVMPSTFETQGLVALESLYFSTPVVAADIGGLKDVIGHGHNGYLFEPGNSKECAEYIMKSAENIEYLSENAGKSVDSYKPETITEKTVNLYREVIKRKNQ